VFNVLNSKSTHFPKEWDFWMNKCCTDEDGNPYGWGLVLDYLGIDWKDIP